MRIETHGIVLRDDVLAPHAERADRLDEARGPAPTARLACAAAHLAMAASYREVDHAADRPGPPDELAAHVDWSATVGLRARLVALGFRVAEAMDTAQRFEIGWPLAERLIRETAGLGAPFVAGAAADHVDPDPSTTPDDPQVLDALADAVAWQARFVHDQGGTPVLLPQPRLAAAGLDEDGFVAWYDAVLAGVDGPVLLHWLGEMFHPAMRGYFPGRSLPRILAAHPEQVRGVKLSLLDADLERRLRDELAPRGQVVLTGDDFHFGALIEGDDLHPTGAFELGGERFPVGRFSHALLGVLDGVAAPAALALRLLAHGDVAGYRAVIEPCEAFGRAVFEAPTSEYKTGLAFVAWLNHHQPEFLLANHREHARSAEHLLRVASLAAAAGAIEDATAAGERLERWMEGRGPERRRARPGADEGEGGVRGEELR